MMPIVSVVIPTYNRQLKLKRALDSVLDQTLKDIEVIVVDNASVDGSQAYINSLQDPRIRYIRHETNRGGPAARNTGIKSAKASLIALLDDDDEWFPAKLAKQVEKFKQASSDTGLVYTSAEIYDESKQKILSVNPTGFRGQVYTRMLLSTILGSATVLIKRECFDRIGTFDENLSSCQDWDMWLRISQAYEFDYVDEVLARINVHGDQISADYAKLIPGRTRMVQKHAQEFSKYPDIYVTHLKRVGKLHCINGTWTQSFPWFQKAVKLRPLEIIKILGWCLLELPWVKYCSPARNFKRFNPSTTE
jgi:glycosyltransferase involved in cell wall biosynthesis